MSSVPVAIVLAVAAAGFFAFAASEQHAVVRTTVDGRSSVLGPRRVLALLRSRAWLGGIGLGGVGSVLHIGAVALAPISIVQPIGVLAVPLGVLIQSRRTQTPVPRRVLGAVALTVAGVVCFVVVTALGAHSTNEVRTQDIGLTTLGVLGVAIGVALLGSRGPAWLRCITCAAAGAVLYGLTSALVRAIVLLVNAGRGWEGPLWIIGGGALACLFIGGWLIQQAFAHGPAEVILGALTVIDPIVAVVFGIVFLGEGDRNTMTSSIVMAVAGIVAAVGVVLLARHHPDAKNAPRPITDPEPELR